MKTDYSLVTNIELRGTDIDNCTIFFSCYTDDEQTHWQPEEPPYCEVGDILTGDGHSIIDDFPEAELQELGHDLEGRIRESEEVFLNQYT